MEAQAKLREHIDAHRDSSTLQRPDAEMLRIIPEEGA